jgi:hypothetical protein
MIGRLGISASVEAAANALDGAFFLQALESAARYTSTLGFGETEGLR